MKLVLRLIIFSLLLTATAYAQTYPPPIVHAIVPNTAPITGGGAVAIHGERLGLPPGFACILPCPAKVTFGDVTVSADSETDALLTVKAPAHAEGTVDVIVTTGDNRRVVVPAGFTFLPVIEAAYERILIPVYLDGQVRGANESIWATQLWMRNNGNIGVTIAPWVCPPSQVCPPVIPLTRTLQSGESLQNLPAYFRPPTSNVSRVIYARTEGIDALSTHLRIFDVSRSGLDAGAEIPVIRERDLLTRAASLHAVPLNEQFRLTLRVYDVSRSDSRFRVRVYPEGTTGDGVSPLLDVELTTRLNETGEFKTQAAYAEYTEFLNVIGPVNRPGSVRVVVEPLTSGSRFWTFVSITNNETQRVTLVTP